MKQRTGGGLGAAVIVGVMTVVAALAGPAARDARAQLPELAETIEVRVVNVDVIVTDVDGRPILGLGPQDFVLKVRGKPVDVQYFAAFKNGLAADAADTADAADAKDAETAETSEIAVETEADSDALPYLVILFDGRSLDTVGAADTFEALHDQVDDLLASSRGVMVVRHGHRLTLSQSFTTNAELLRRAIDGLSTGRVRQITTAARDLLMRRMDIAPPIVDNPMEDAVAQANAISFIGEIRGQAEDERRQSLKTIEDLSRFVRSLSGLPGRKAILYLGPGFATRPGEMLYRVWWAKYSRIAGELGVDHVDREVSRYRLENEMVELIADANANNVEIHAFDPAGLRPLGFRAASDSAATAQLAGLELEWGQEALLGLAAGTGGVGRVDSGRLDLMVGRMVSGFRNYYSLGFEPAEGQPETGRIEVKIAGQRGKNYQIRHLNRYFTRSAKRRLEERTMAALLTDEERNPLNVGVELAKPEKQTDGTFIVPILVKLPISGLTLLPRDDSHIGRLSVVVIAQGGEGEVSDPAHGDVPLEIDNKDLLAALGRMAGYRMRLKMAAGEQRLAIGVRDEVTGEDSTVNLVVDPGEALR